VKKSKDPILSETRAARERLVARFNYDLDALCEHLREMEKEFEGRVVTLPPKKPATRVHKAS